MAAARIALGHVDVLVANHAASVGGTLDELTAAAIDTALVVNVRGTLLLVKEFAAGFERDHGRVVLFTSGQGRGPMPERAALRREQGGPQRLGRLAGRRAGAARYHHQRRQPGPTDTGWAPEEVRREVEAAMPHGRWGTPEDAARLVAWLASEESGWVTGQVDRLGRWVPVRRGLTNGNCAG